MATSTPTRCRVPATGKIQFSNTADLELQCRSYTALLDTPTVHTIGKISIKYFRNIHTRMVILNYSITYKIFIHTYSALFRTKSRLSQTNTRTNLEIQLFKT
jgi:hypothetical protein